MTKRLLFVLSVLLPTIASATVIESTNLSFSSQSSWLGQYVSTVFQEISGNSTSVFFNKADNALSARSTITAVNWNVDEESDYYLVPYGAEFSAKTIAERQFSPLFVLDHASSIQVKYSAYRYNDFYLGINTGVGFSQGSNGYLVPGREVFGWVKLRNSSTGLLMLDNAMAYGEGGIVIGTNTAIPIPEPESYAMLLAGMGILGLVACRRKPA